MKKSNLGLLLLVCLLGLNSEVKSQDMLILPMPGQKLPAAPAQQQKPQPSNKAHRPANGNVQPPTPNKSNKISNPNNTFIPLPNQSNNSTSSTQPQTNRPQPQQINNSSNKQQQIGGNAPLIAIPTKPASKKYDDDFIPPPPPPLVKKNNGAADSKPSTLANTSTEEDLSSFFNDTDFPMLEGDTAANSAGSKVEDLLPPTQQETTVANETTGESITVYPKDTGSAVFMVMKSWKCDDYDCSKLLEQAVEVYGKEADDTFKINGLSNIAQGLTVSVEEEDITLDELLDVLAAKTGNDWGADVPNKIIYVYPKGIKTESYVSWD